LAVGTHPVVAKYLGSSDFSASSSSADPLTIVKATTSTVLSVSPTTVAYGSEQTVVFKFVVNSQFGETPTGTVRVSSGTTTLCTITLVHGTGTCSLKSKTLKVGTYQIVASYSGSSSYEASSSTDEKLTVT
jgi:hypothetical protein